MIRVILFDLDETLYPPASGVMEAFRTRVVRYVRDRLKLPTSHAEALRRRYFREYGTTLRGLQANHGVDPEEYMAYVHDLPLEQFLAANPDLDATLAAIRLDKIVFTNASREHAERVLDLLQVRHHFRQIVDVRDVGFESKPQPEAYRRVCDLLHVHPDECVIVDDNTRNLQPARALGMTTVLVNSSQTHPLTGIDFVISRIEEIGTVVAELHRSAPEQPG